MRCRWEVGVSNGAIGILETRGMASLMGATDAMLKSAEVQICGRHGIGSGWLTVVIEGQVAAVQTAIGIGAAEANRAGELISSRVVPRPEALAIDAMPHGGGLGAGEIGPWAIGLLETQGLTPLIAGADQMVKSAHVELMGWAFIGGALCHALVSGDVAAVQTAVAAGRQAAAQIGTVYATLVLPQPIGGLGPLLPPQPAAEPRSTGALGLLETIGYATVVGGADAMIKAAAVEIERLNIGSGGRITALATGNLDDVQAAIAAHVTGAAQDDLFFRCRGRCRVPDLAPAAPNGFLDPRVNETTSMFGWAETSSGGGASGIPAFSPLSNSAFSLSAAWPGRGGTTARGDPARGDPSDTSCAASSAGTPPFEDSTFSSGNPNLTCRL